MPELRLEGLATDLIGPVSLDIAAGECVALMGPSGAGKSLFLRAIVDLDPGIGRVLVGDRARSDMPAGAWRRLVSLVPAESGWWADRVGDHFPPGDETQRLTEVVGARRLAPVGGQPALHRRAAEAGDCPRTLRQSARAAARRTDGLTRR